MKAIFQGKELLKLAMRMEENGRDFYGRLAKRLADPPAQALFSNLARQEEVHCATFDRMLAGAGGFAPPESQPGEYDLYLNTYADAQIFTAERMEKYLALPKIDVGEALLFAISLENEAILFFTTMKNAAPLGLKPVEEIIAEEDRHLEQLLSLRRRNR